MRNTPIAALLGALVVTFLVALPLELSGQGTKTKTKQPVAKRTPTAAASRSFELGSETPVNNGVGNGAVVGKDTHAPVQVTNTNDPAAPIYKGPIAIPPSVPQPNDSAHSHPPH
jgi:hypothetical protein